MKPDFAFCLAKPAPWRWPTSGRRQALVLALTFASCLFSSAVPAHAWGARGHMMCGRVAAQALPEDMPLFFRAASERLAYLIPEPDRWRGEAWGGLQGPRQELTNLTASNHNIRMELLQDITFPRTRNEYIVLAVERGIVPREDVNMHKVGAVFYAMVEEAQRLTVQFRLWREAQEAPALDPAAVQQIQENAILSGGVLGHWITDSAQPLHTTVHSDDWDARFTNPKAYQTRQIHGRFETVYVDRAIRESDIAVRMTPVRLLTDCRQEAEAHIRRSFGRFEEVYALDRRGAFGSGQEQPEAHAFTAARLAEGAALLHDAWYSAWKKSEEELLDTPVRYLGAGGRSVLDLLRQLKRVETSEEAGGLQVVAIGVRRNRTDGRRWRYFVNGQPLGAGLRVVVAGATATAAHSISRASCTIPSTRRNRLTRQKSFGVVHACGARRNSSSAKETALQGADRVAPGPRVPTAHRETWTLRISSSGTPKNGNAPPGLKCTPPARRCR